MTASEQERARLGVDAAAAARQVDAAVNQLRDCQARADRSEERARDAAEALEKVVPLIVNMAAVDRISCAQFAFIQVTQYGLGKAKQIAITEYDGLITIL